MEFDYSAFILSLGQRRRIVIGNDVTPTTCLTALAVTLEAIEHIDILGLADDHRVVFSDVGG
ncbi:hypothetical protein EXIGLDRAFT_724259 [Exidia glandulosa HHB12029]|uniref:Uncharacterized protein n=1 Tax=Exidia glandulosa HHB12029 TaxID=1314781 RepID=A0A165MSP3_EXIGL|nr:hypothetical protein EXIGLDRAFT_724259 [Exidia glandulosa HHB12029]